MGAATYALFSISNNSELISLERIVILTVRVEGEIDLKLLCRGLYAAVHYVGIREVDAVAEHRILQQMNVIGETFVEENWNLRGNNEFVSDRI